jgi:hypothetical protein
VGGGSLDDQRIAARGATSTVPKAQGETMRSLAYYITLLLLAFTSEATFAADADHGSVLAKRWCSFLPHRLKFPECSN